MSDLIDRQAAIDVLDKIFPADPMRNDYTQGITCGAALATEYIKQLPSAQPDLSGYSDRLWRNAYERGKRDAQIIRCKDCKHGSPNGKYGCRVYHYRRYETHDMEPDDFCSRAERETDG